MNTQIDYLALVDWRRRVAALYAEVRRIGAREPQASWDLWRSERERLYREHPQSPLPPALRAGFRADHFPYDPAYRFALPILHELPATAADDAVAVPTSAGDTATLFRVGWVEVPFPAGLRRLAVCWLPDYAGGLFLSFRDASNGRETYGGGRYLLDGAKSADLGSDYHHGVLVLDFNFAYQPSCAFDPRWVCPLVPGENRLDLRIEVGERVLAQPS